MPPGPAPGGQTVTLNSTTVQLVLGRSGALRVVFLDATGAWRGSSISNDTFALVVDGSSVFSPSLGVPLVYQWNETAASMVYPPWQPMNGPQGVVYNITVLYTVNDGFAGASFMSKTVSVFATSSSNATSAMGGVKYPAMTIYSVIPWYTLILSVDGSPALSSTLYPSALGTGGQGLFLRFNDTTGVMVTAANGFLSSSVSTEGASTVMSLGYHPVLTWNQTLEAQPVVPGCTSTEGCLWSGRPVTPADGLPQPFVADSAYLSMYALSAYAVPPPVIPAPSDVDSVPGVTGNWKAHVFSQPAALAWDPTWMNYAERDALRYLLEYHYLSPPVSSTEGGAGTVKINVGWCENDYQIDVSNATSLQEYARIIAFSGAIGLTHILAAPQVSSIMPHTVYSDGWGWESALFLGEGVNIRYGNWTPGTNDVPAVITDFTALPAQHGVRLIPYVYPTLGFQALSPVARLPTYSVNGQVQSGVRLDDRAVQEYLATTIAAFSQATGTMGMSVDYMMWDWAVNSSVYSLWHGWRRVQRELRLSALGSSGSAGYSGFVMDNRCCTQWWGPWQWTQGTYTSPLQHDEQPESWQGYVNDLKTDRLSANLQRAMSYPYMTYQLSPPSAVPGFVHHNSDRWLSGQNGPSEMPWTDLNARDYDYYGCAYSLLSSIATGGLNNVINMIPARDAGEYNAFPVDVPGDATSASTQLYRTWLQWADAHVQWLRRAQVLPFPPGPGVVDGTYASYNGTVYVFLFNPNSMALPVGNGSGLLLDEGLGLSCSTVPSVLLREVWPIARLLSVQDCGSALQWQMEGKSALVLQVTSAAETLAQASLGSPVLLGRATRAATVTKEGSRVRAVQEELGQHKWTVEGLRDVVADKDNHWIDCGPASAYILLPASLPASSTAQGLCTSRPVSGLAVDAGRCLPGPLNTPRAPAGYVLMPVYSPSLPSPGLGGFIHNQAVSGMAWSNTQSWTGGQLSGTVDVPQQVFDQLAARNSSYPVPWTPSDAAVPWLIPGRMLLFLDTTPGAWSPGWANNGSLTATLDGTPVQVLEAYNCRSKRDPSCFNGYWIDLSSVPAPVAIQPGEARTLVISLLPPLTVPQGSLLGVYYDNIDTVDVALEALVVS